MILVGATTENPSFEVNAPLLSRAKVVVLKPLSEEDLRIIIDRALADPDRGLGREPIDCPDEMRDQLAREARGDARRALSTLESAAAIAALGADGRRLIDREVVEEALQRKTLVYDKAGDEHYMVVSAFIKSMRGSDPDAAVYWMARMLEAGEDPLFVLRRMVIFAAEDIGNADPNALRVAMAATDAFRFVGLPEGYLPMSQAAIYLAVAPKSNTSLTTYAAAKRDVEEHGALAGADASAQRQLGARQVARLRPGLPVSAQLRGPLRRRGLPARGSCAAGATTSPSPSGRERDIGEYLAKLRKPEK